MVQHKAAVGPNTCMSLYSLFKIQVFKWCDSSLTIHIQASFIFQVQNLERERDSSDNTSMQRISAL